MALFFHKKRLSNPAARLLCLVVLARQKMRCWLAAGGLAQANRRIGAATAVKPVLTCAVAA
uniref:Uncharacterized protein n=1 Tax=Kalanchoe fedtschenkoi TaxID=63787 RepID=A0A7N0UVK0_KALFE